MSIDTQYRIMSVGWSVVCPPVKTTFPNIQNKHENSVNHDDPSNAMIYMIKVQESLEIC